MSKKSIGTGITKLLFGLKGKDLKVIPFNEMSPQQFEELDRFLGKLGFILASDDYKLTTKQANYVIDQIKQLDLYRERRIKDKYTDFIDFIPRDKLGIPSADKAKEFKGFKPKVVEGGKGKSQTPVKDKVESQLGGIKLRGDETFSEIEFIRRFKKHPRDVVDVPKRPADFDTYPYEEQVDIDIDNENVYKQAVEKALEDGEYAGGGLVNLIAKLRAKFGKKAVTTADKIDRPARAKLADEFKAFNKRNRQLTDEDIKDYELELGDAETWYESGMTVADAEKLVANRKAYEAQMLIDYKAGRLDPKPGEPGRREYLERKLQEAQMSGDKRLIDPDELDELTDFEFRERTMNAEGGLATMFRPKREKFIFGGGVGFKNLLKSIAKKQGMDKPSDVLKKGNPKSQVPKRAKPFVSDRDMADMNLLRIQQLENKLELLKTGRSLLANRDNFPPQFREVGDDMVRMMMPPEMRQMLKGSTVESLDREILQIENVLKNLKVGKDKRALNADGGLASMFRPRLKNGGPPNPGRRTFLKLMAGLASLPIVGKLFKPAKIATVVPLKNTTTTMPTWFPDFVDKMVTKNIGNKIDADVMLYKDKDLPGVELYKYDDGRIEVQGKNAYDSEYDITYTPPGVEVLDYKTGKSVKTPGDFEASDTVYRRTGPEMDDYDVDGEIVDDVEDILGGNSTMLEGYATGTGKSKYTAGQYQIDRAEAMNERADFPEFEVDPTDYIDEVEDIEPFRKGGLATMFRKK